MPIAEYECVDCGDRREIVIPQPETIEMTCNCSYEKDIGDDWVVGTAFYKRVWSPVRLGAGSSGEPAR